MNGLAPCVVMESSRERTDGKNRATRRDDEGCSDEDLGFLVVLKNQPAIESHDSAHDFGCGKAKSDVRDPESSVAVSPDVVAEAPDTENVVLTVGSPESPVDEHPQTDAAIGEVSAEQGTPLLHAQAPLPGAHPTSGEGNASQQRSAAPVSGPDADTSPENAGEAEPLYSGGHAAVPGTKPAPPQLSERTDSDIPSASPAVGGKPDERSRLAPGGDRFGGDEGADDHEGEPAPALDARPPIPAPRAVDADDDAGINAGTLRSQPPVVPVVTAAATRGAEVGMAEASFERLERIRDTVRQLASHAFREGHGRAGALTVTLHPASLGRLILSCREIGDRMTLRITTETEAARESVESLRHDMQRLAQQEGFRSVQFDVRADADGERRRERWEGPPPPRGTGGQNLPPAGQESPAVAPAIGHARGINRGIHYVA